MKQICEKALPWLSVALELASITSTVSGAVKAVSNTSSHLADSFVKHVGLKPKTNGNAASNLTDGASEATDDLTTSSPAVTDAERMAAERMVEELHVAIELKTFDTEKVDYGDSITPASSRPITFRDNESGLAAGLTTLQVQQQHPIGAGVFPAPSTSFVNQALARSQSSKNDVDDKDSDEQQL